MLPRSRRLSTEEFMAVLKEGRVVHSPLFLMRVVKGVKNSRDTLIHPKFAAVSPKKTSKTAVARNKTRRRIYEAVQKHYSRVSPGTKGAIFAKNDITVAPFTAVVADVEQLFVKAGILK